MSGYPRKELCPCCEKREVEVVSPGDTFSVCSLCHLALLDEYTSTLSEALRLEEAHLLTVIADPASSDCAVSDAVLELRR